MPSPHLLWPFLVATLVFAAVPGPAILYTAARTLVGGRRAGLMAALGVHLGGYGYVAATALGLSALLHYVPILYDAVKMCAAAYLVWLGLCMVGRRVDAGAPASGDRRIGSRAFAESVTVELLNPKTAIFFVAFLPQFADPGAGLPVAIQLLALGTIVNLAFSTADLITVLLASLVLRELRRGMGAQRLARIAGGSILVGVGTHLALVRN